MDIQALDYQVMRFSGVGTRLFGALAARMARRLLLLVVVSSLAASSRPADESRPSGIRLLADGAFAFEWPPLEEDGHTSATVDEPGSSFWLRWRQRLLSLLVDERDL